LIFWNNGGSARSGEGYGDSSSNIVSNLIKHGVPISVYIPDIPEEIKKMDFGIDYASFSASNDSPVIVNNCLPEMYVTGSQYSIGFTYWETTALNPRWVDDMNKMDEIWTTSEFMKNVFINSGVHKPVYAFSLGVDPELYSPCKKKPRKKFTFLSMGSPSTRKNSQMAVDAFLYLFGRDENYKLIYKSNGPPDARLHKDTDKQSSIHGHPRIEVIDWKLSESLLSALYDEVDCLLYPTSGEGWGLIPFQAIAKGIPTICTNATACEEYAEMSVPLDYKWSNTNMTGIYNNTGEWAEPSFDDLCDKMLYVVKNYDDVSNKTLEGARHINENMTWEKVTKEYAERLWQILNDTRVKP
jgi:glycosyltransferase involved in cell wall biosynthesis